VPYEVHLDGALAWPALEGLPPSVIRVPAPEAPLHVAFGSCRVCAPNTGPEARTKDEDRCGRGPDALRALAQRMTGESPATWPDLLVMLGDQVYADEPSPGMRELARARRDTTIPPGETVADYEEYTALYREAWGEPLTRWLLSTVPSAMIFDDHDVHDDWNASRSWVEDMRAKGWWDRRIVGGFSSYWVYQHLGNLSPQALDADALYAAVKDVGDATAILRDFAFRADREVSGAMWSYARDVGGVRLVMIDSRAGRVLDPGRRSMIDAREWDWIEEHATGDVEHLLIGTSLPLYLGAHGLHDLETWNEAVCDGSWGRPAAWIGERLRRAGDLEHWAAFRESFERLSGLLERISRGERGRGPGSIVVLSGDVHHCYLAEVGFAAPAGGRAPVWQATCSPFRNPLSKHERQLIRFAFGPVAGAIGRALARAAGVPASPVGWRLAHDGPYFENQIGTLELDGREGRLRFERAVADPDDSGRARLESVFAHRLDA
jgi:hypothetical protein